MTKSDMTFGALVVSELQPLVQDIPLGESKEFEVIDLLSKDAVEISSLTVHHRMENDTDTYRYVASGYYQNPTAGSRVKGFGLSFSTNEYGCYGRGRYDIGPDYSKPTKTLTGGDARDIATRLFADKALVTATIAKFKELILNEWAVVNRYTDAELFDEFSDQFKDENGFRPRTKDVLLTFLNVDLGYNVKEEDGITILTEKPAI